MKTILVTGAAKGIGLEVVRQLARLNHRVILTAREESKARLAVDRLKSEGLSVAFESMDIDREDHVQLAANQVQAGFGKLDVLINNAAILDKRDLSLIDINPDIYRRTLHTNTFAQLTVITRFLPLIPVGGRIINTSSGGGSMTDPVGGWSPAYCVSKSLLNSITRHLAFELTGRGITVNAYCPGWVRTDMGGRSAPRSVERGADTAVWLATEPEIPTGKFFRDRKVIPW